MKVKYYLLGSVFSLLVACSPSLSLTNVQPQKNIVVGKEYEEDENMLHIIAPYKNKLDAQMNQKVSYTSIELNRVGDNSNLGVVLSDYLFEGANDWAKKNGIERVDASILNIGGIRNNIGVGDILLRHIFEVMPFENEMVIIKMKGGDIQGIFDYYEKNQKNNPVSHLYIEVEKGKLKNALINGESPQLEKEYYIATSDYLAQGGDSMYFFAKGEMIKTGITLRDLFIEYFKKNLEVKVSSDVRLKFIR